KFGEMFQYSNQLAAAGGFVGGHVAFPALELGAAYDEAMRTRVFSPLGMTATTFDYDRALNGNHASPHALCSTRIRVHRAIAGPADRSIDRYTAAHIIRD